MSALDPKQRELLLQIAQCELADDTLDDLLSDAPSLDSPCAGICDYQIQQSVEAGHSRDEYTKTMFHVPEPWNGNLETAEILFVSSNPSFDPNEEFPKLANDSWPDEKVVDFFVHRFNDSNYGNRFWSAVRKTAAYILGETKELRKLSETDTRDRKIIRSVESRTAITEAVHCKSRSETVSPIGGQNDKLGSPVFQECFGRHTRPVINYFLQSPGRVDHPKTVVFIGKLTRDYVLKLGKDNAKDDADGRDRPLDEKAEDQRDLQRQVNPQRGWLRGMDKDQLLARLQDFCMEEFGKNYETARFLFIPHPNARGLKDIDRQKIIYDQLKLWS